MKKYYLLAAILCFAILPKIGMAQPITASQGEQVNLTLKLVNIGDANLHEVNAQLDPLTTPRWIRSETGKHQSVDVPSKQPTKNNLDARPSVMLPLAFTVDPEAPENVEVHIQVLIRDGGGQVWTKRFPLTILPRPKPDTSRLFQNYPNPFNPETWIPYQLASPARVSIHIYDPQGGSVRTLDLGHQDSGFYTSRTEAAYWDGRNNSGERVSSGLYFYQIQTDHFSAIHRMVIVK